MITHCPTPMGHWKNQKCHDELNTIAVAEYCAMRPESRGEVALSSDDPLAAPMNDPNFLRERGDVETMIRGFKLTRRIMESPAMDAIRGKPVYIGNVHTDEEIEQEIRTRADSVYHPVGTCKMGTGEHAVVGPSLRVHGLENIYVADASTMPTIISGNTNAPTIMIAEKVADLITAV